MHRSGSRWRGFRPRPPIAPGVWVLLALAALVAARLLQTDGEPASFPVSDGGALVVERVVDGDTLLMSDRSRVRLLGVDTPETKRPDLPVDPLGLEAAEFVRERVEGRAVRLEFDRERRDRYHRILAYVYVGERLLNEELIRAGYSRAETRFPYSETMKRRFRDAEHEAQEARRGMWAR